MTPVDRSNSPPIISSATATAMIPIREEPFSHVLTPSSDRNLSV
jgi:hypothetical protein